MDPKVEAHLKDIPKILIKQGTVVNADTPPVECDILLEGGKIKSIAVEIKPDDKITTVINAKGMFILPGGIDPHTHLDFEFMGTKTADDFYTGTVAAVAGGTTTIIDFCAPKVGESLSNALERYHKKANGKAVCDYTYHMIITWWSKEICEEMGKICKEDGINSYKMFMAYKDMLMLNDTELYQAFLRCKSIGALPMVHAENGSIIAENVKRLLENGITGPEGHDLSRPEDIEAEATFRACTIAGQVKCPLYVVHVMTDAAANVVKNQKEKGVKVIGETLAAAIGSTGAPNGCSFRVGAFHVMSPPISHDKCNPEKMVKHLATGTLDCIGSDNCTFNCEQKEQLGKDDFSKIPNGVNGVEDRMRILWQTGVNSKQISVQQFVAITSTNAAKIFNIFPKKGFIGVGSDADIVIWNPSKKKIISSLNHKQACDFNIFEGMEIVGNPEYVFVKGMCCLENDKVIPVKGFGSFLKCPCYADVLYDLLIKNGTVVNHNCSFQGDVLTSNGKIIKVSKNISPRDNPTVIDATGMLVIPGGIDASTHFDTDFIGVRTADDFFTGTRAAVIGGTTMIMDYVIPRKRQRYMEAFIKRKNLADEQVVCDYALHTSITSWNEYEIKHLENFAKKAGINSFKVFLGFKKRLMLTDDIISIIFRKCGEIFGLCMAHAENGYLIEENSKEQILQRNFGPLAHYNARTIEVEAEGVFRACSLASSVLSPLYVCHVMSDYAADVLAERIDNCRVPIYGEVIAAALGSKGPPSNAKHNIMSFFVRSPPIRQNPENHKLLMKRLGGNLLQVTASDDCSFLQQDKLRNKKYFREIPCGVNGVEDRMAIVWSKGVKDGYLTKERFVAVTSTNTAKIFNLYPNKGLIANGSDADIVVWEPSEQRKISYFGQHQSCDYNVFQDEVVSGMPKHVVVRGFPCYQNGVVNVKRGFGKYIKTKLKNPFIYSKSGK